MNVHRSQYDPTLQTGAFVARLNLTALYYIFIYYTISFQSKDYRGQKKIFTQPNFIDKLQTPSESFPHSNTRDLFGCDKKRKKKNNTDRQVQLVMRVKCILIQSIFIFIAWILPHPNSSNGYTEHHYTRLYTGITRTKRMNHKNNPLRPIATHFPPKWSTNLT